MTSIVHLCIDCKKLPEKPADLVLPSGANWVRAGYQPKKPAKIITREGEPKRCTHHKQTFKGARRKTRQAWSIQNFAGITDTQYWEIHRHQGGKCAFPRCRATGKTKRLAIHHDHGYAATHCSHDPVTEACPNCVVALLCGPHNQDLMGKWLGDLDDAIAIRDGKICPAQEILNP